MAKVDVGKKIKDCKIECTDTKKTKLSDFLKKNLLLYFYPRDMTPGCTTESIEFNANLSKIKKLNYELVGVSRDSIKYNITRGLVLIPLITIYFIGPFGLVLYWFIRIFYAKRLGFHD